MIQGTASDAGKSVLVSALCRIYARRRVKVAPFKAQNMALNSYVTPEGHEIGRAQAVQAQAAKIEPHVDMNPILLKPEAESRSQVIVMGKPWKTLAAGSYFRSKQLLWKYVVDSLARLDRRYELIIIEGAGSPAEINLKKDDIVNMRVARHLCSPVLLVGDIDKGGVFASLYGTYALLEEEERELLKGFIMNKFRGDKSLLLPGLEMLAGLTGGRPTLGVIPFLKNLYLAQEDSVFLDTNTTFGDTGEEKGLDIAVVRLPHISNYDDFDPLTVEKGVQLRFIDSPRNMGNPDALIIPGSKTTIHDLMWLRESGLERAIKGKLASGASIVGICGGYQMMGTRIRDPQKIESNMTEIDGLNLLPVETEFNTNKTTRRIRLKILENAGFLSGLKGSFIEGYEIHMGQTIYREDTLPLFEKVNGDPDGAAAKSGSIWGSYLHGIFDNHSFRRAWLISLGWMPDEPEGTEVDLREREFERLADHVENNMDMALIDKMVGI
jgi:adenosylcobyric acid synthase